MTAQLMCRESEGTAFFGQLLGNHLANPACAAGVASYQAVVSTVCWVCGAHTAATLSRRKDTADLRLPKPENGHHCI